MIKVILEAVLFGITWTLFEVHRKKAANPCKNPRAARKSARNQVCLAMFVSLVMILLLLEDAHVINTYHTFLATAVFYVLLKEKSFPSK
jgi:hypothetical protein